MTLHTVNFSFQDRTSWEVSVTDCSRYQAGRACITICHHHQPERPLTVLNVVTLTVLQLQFHRKETEALESGLQGTLESFEFLMLFLSEPHGL